MNEWLNEFDLSYQRIAFKGYYEKKTNLGRKGPGKNSKFSK